MSIWEILLYINIILGLFAFLLHILDKGELLIKDFLPGIFIVALGGITFWVFFYERYKAEINMFIAGLGKIGSKPLWRSRGIRAKEALFGEVKDDDD